MVKLAVTTKELLHFKPPNHFLFFFKFNAHLFQFCLNFLNNIFKFFFFNAYMLQFCLNFLKNIFILLFFNAHLLQYCLNVLNNIFIFFILQCSFASILLKLSQQYFQFFYSSTLNSANGCNAMPSANKSLLLLQSPFAWMSFQFFKNFRNFVEFSFHNCTRDGKSVQNSLNSTITHSFLALNFFTVLKVQY